MTAVGMLVAWFGYGNSVYGWCLLRGYDVTWTELMSPFTRFAWDPSKPPDAIPDTQVWPSKASRDSAAEGSGGPILKGKRKAGPPPKAA